jgi:hypothetical protein
LYPRFLLVGAGSRQPPCSETGGIHPLLPSWGRAPFNPPVPIRRQGVSTRYSPLWGRAPFNPPVPIQRQGVSTRYSPLGGGLTSTLLSLSGDRGYPPVTPLFGGGLPSTPLSLSGDRGYPPVTPLLGAGSLQHPHPYPETGGIHQAVSKFADVFITGWKLTSDQGGLTNWPPQFQEPRLPFPEFLIFFDSEARIHTQV